MGIEQHLVCLEQIRPQEKRPAVRQFDMRNLQLNALAADDGIVLTPIELECFAWAERQRNEYASARRLLLTLSIRPPITGEGRNPAIGTGKAHRYQIGMKLFHRSALLA